MLLIIHSYGKNRGLIAETLLEAQNIYGIYNDFTNNNGWRYVCNGVGHAAIHSPYTEGFYG